MHSKTKQYILLSTIIVFVISGLLALYFLYNPSNSSFFPKCLFYKATGLHCPGCGTQRALHNILQGNIFSGFRHNLLLILLIIIFIRSPWGQNIIVDKVVNYVSEKTNTRVEIEKLFITFDGDVQLNGLYLEDKKGDTLVFSKSLEANVPLWKMIQGEAIGVDNLEWDGLRANIIRKDSRIYRYLKK